MGVGGVILVVVVVRAMCEVSLAFHPAFVHGVSPMRNPKGKRRDLGVDVSPPAGAADPRRPGSPPGRSQGPRPPLQRILPHPS